MVNRFSLCKGDIAALSLRSVFMVIVKRRGKTVLISPALNLVLEAQNKLCFADSIVYQMFKLLKRLLF